MGKPVYFGPVAGDDHGDLNIKQRIYDWLQKRYDDGGSFDDTSELLLEFYKYLQECEAAQPTPPQNTTPVRIAADRICETENLTPAKVRKIINEQLVAQVYGYQEEGECSSCGCGEDADGRCTNLACYRWMAAQRTDQPDALKADTLFGIYCNGRPESVPNFPIGIIHWDAWQRLADWLNQKAGLSASAPHCDTCFCINKQRYAKAFRRVAQG